MKSKIIALIFALIILQSLASAFLISDQGTDVVNVSTGNLTSSANLTIDIYDSATGGTLIFEQNFSDGIINGSWNVMIDPDLEYGTIYYKDYRINGEDLDFDGNERLQIQSAVGDMNNVSFINFSLIDSCAAGSSIRLIYENGSVLCETDSDAGTPNLTGYALKNQSEIFTGNISTTQTGFFGWLGSLALRITKLFVQDIEFNGTINGSGNITTTGNITASFFCNATSCYTMSNLVDSSDDAWINETIYNKTEIIAINTSMKNYVDTQASYNDAWINNTINVNITLANDSINNWITQNNVSVNNWITENNVSVTNAIADLGTYGDTWINETIYNKTEIIAINTSMKNYVDAQASYTDAWINQTIAVNISDANTSMKNYVDFQDLAYNDSVNNWITENNESVTNYIDAQASYNDAWINQTIYNKTEVIAINTSMKNYVDFQDLAFNTSVNNYIAENNVSVNNYIDSQDLAYNDSVKNYIAENNASVNNYITGSYINISGENAVQDVNISPYDFEAENLVLSKSITFNFGEIIDNIIGGWIRITGNLDVSGNINATGAINATGNITTTDTFCFNSDCSAKMYYNGSGIIISS